MNLNYLVRIIKDSLKPSLSNDKPIKIDQGPPSSKSKASNDIDLFGKIY